MDNIIVIAILVLIIGLASFYIYKSKKSGKKCIGCSESGNCSARGKASCCCGTPEEYK